jgi:hypothetical protein
MLCTVRKVWEIEIADIVADDEIWIHLLQEVPPFHQHLLFPFKLEDLGIDNQTRSIEAEYISDERLLFSVSSDNVCDLDDWILVGFWEDPLSPGTFNIKGKDSQRRHLGPFSFWLMCDQISVCYLGLDLTIGMPLVLGDQFV